MDIAETMLLRQAEATELAVVTLTRCQTADEVRAGFLLIAELMSIVPGGEAFVESLRVAGQPGRFDDSHVFQLRHQILQEFPSQAELYRRIARKLSSTPAEKMSGPVSAPPEAESPPVSFPARLLGVFISPGETFQDIARRPGFIAPLIVAIVSGLVILETMIFKIGMGRIVRQSIEQSGQAAKMSAEQLENAVRMGATLGTIFGHVAVLVFGPAMLLILAALGLGILVLIFGAEAKFKAIFSATCYANLVGVLGVLMGVALILFGDPEHFNAQNPIPSNVGFFLNPLETSKPLYSLAGSADILWIWTMVLMAMGWSRTSDGKAKTLPVFLTLAGIWMIWVLGKMGFAAIFS
jgi:hypothetical protein